MHTLNLIVLDKKKFITSDCFSSYLQNIPVICKRELPIQDFLNNTALYSSDINLFLGSHLDFFHASRDLPLRAFLEAYTYSINLCLLTDEKPLDSDLAARFHDFIIWPCSHTEFHLRLTPFLKREKTQPCDNQKLLAEFSKLNLIGECSTFVQNVQLIKKMSGCHAAVLIQGETGTGKENAARAIHYLSKRNEHSFVPINCAAIPDDLIESELFGHEKGSFTDAKQNQIGLVTLASGGTLFLDEVDSLSAKAQAVLLRFLQTQEYRPLGSRKMLRADVRILVATNADLQERVNEKLFREDLFFRLNVLNLTMPPLRERVNDIPLLAFSFLERFSTEYQTSPKRISPKSMLQLMNKPWPGNIRELENCLLRSFLLSSGNYLEFSDKNKIEQNAADLSAINHSANIGSASQTFSHSYRLESEQLASEQLTSEELASEEQINLDLASEFSSGDYNTPLSFQDAKAKAITEFEAHYLKKIMSMTNGNVSAAARMAGKERRALGKLLQKYDIDKMQFSPSNR